MGSVKNLNLFVEWGSAHKAGDIEAVFFRGPHAESHLRTGYVYVRMGGQNEHLAFTAKRSRKLSVRRDQKPNFAKK